MSNQELRLGEVWIGLVANTWPLDLIAIAKVQVPIKIIVICHDYCFYLEIETSF